jgi:hypothetical protein
MISAGGIMCIKTTINIRKDIITKLNHASRILQISKINIVRILLRKYSEHNLEVVMFSSVKYQKRDESSNWHTFHLNLHEDEYEYYGDFRKIYKKSLSLIITDAVNKYLDLIINRINSSNKCNTDSYRLKNYIFFKKKLDGITCGIYFWGLPDNKTLMRYIT